MKHTSEKDMDGWDLLEAACYRGCLRPVYTPEMGKDICDRYARGETTLTIAKELGIHRVTIHVWALKHQDYSAAYKKARESHQMAMLDEMRQIADDNARDIVTDDNGKRKGDNEIVLRSKLRVDTRKTILALTEPEKYSEKRQNLYIHLDELAEAKTPVERIEVITQAVAAGRITPDDAEKLMRIIDLSIKAKELSEVEDKLNALIKLIAEKKS